MTEHDGALRTGRVVLAGVVLIIRESGSVGSRACQDVMPVWRIATTSVDLALFGQRGLLVEVIGAVQLSNVLRNRHTFCIHPRTLPDTVTRADRARALCRQVGVPCFCACTDG